MEVCAPEDTAIVGCAIDIGTTTVTMVLTDLTTGKILAKGSSGNGQIRYGADVINLSLIHIYTRFSCSAASAREPAFSTAILRSRSCASARSSLIFN